MSCVITISHEETRAINRLQSLIKKYQAEYELELLRLEEKYGIDLQHDRLDLQKREIRRVEDANH